MKKIITPLLRAFSLSLIVAFSLSACKTTQTTHGQVIGERQLTALKPGVHQKPDVRAILGSPSTTSTLNGNRWFYVTANGLQKPFTGKEIEEQTVLILDFDTNNTLTQISNKSANTDGLDITPIPGETPTQGEKLGVVEQLLDNLGLGF